MGAVLDVAVRPEPLRGSVVAFVEQSVERLEDERLVLRGRGLGQEGSFGSMGAHQAAQALRSADDENREYRRAK